MKCYKNVMKPKQKQKWFRQFAWKICLQNCNLGDFKITKVLKIKLVQTSRTQNKKSQKNHEKNQKITKKI